MLAKYFLKMKINKYKQDEILKQEIFVYFTPAFQLQA